ncbi:GAF domain-containing sensor histidine kinase [Actinoplanes sp. NEAU-A12]|uniref:Sensor-like histidine kinase SenX3 n=1 Tax=Actinoplanes sandaracinus TaxID=3045177 RepID=A0ABT6X1W5_9ACTN|nr:GAF domain-containing sensor histidine kinase [Actinoplanes sandaracinus]MDI6105904.1 GAF domain-containing sensor histidine kinase [Actinoplanes sandaracinus]
MTDIVTSRRPFPVPADEDARLAALAAYDIVDGAPEPDLQLIAQLAADVCGTARAVVNITAAQYQHQVAAVGMAPQVCDRGDSMCTISILEPAAVVLADASTDPRFADNPHVDGTMDSIRLYAASQLRVGDGQVIGTLCVFDTEVRELTAVQRAGLDRLARMVVDVLELRRHSGLLTEALRDREQTLAELEATHQELLRSNTALQQFAGQVSHDLKNPLTGVLGFISSLAEVPAVADDETATWMLQRVMSSSTRMWRMIEDVLAHAAVSGAPDFVPVALSDITGQVLEDLHDAITAADARIDVDELPAVIGDATQLRVLLQNLIGNAVKYRHPQRRSTIRISSALTGGIQSISVADNGRGIPPADRAKVTELFTRVHTDVEGTGIGLATCQRIIAAHHGTLSFRDTPGGGTTVTVTLPPAPTTASASPCGTAAHSSISPAADATEPAGLRRPSMADARDAVHRSHGDAAAPIWAKLLRTSQLTGHETSDDALPQLLRAMTALDPVSRLCAHAIGIRLAAHTNTATTTRSAA